MEMADLIVVTKADGDLMPAARRAQLEYTSALKFMHPKCDFWRPKVRPLRPCCASDRARSRPGALFTSVACGQVVSVSAVSQNGMQTLSEQVTQFYDAAKVHTERSGAGAVARAILTPPVSRSAWSQVAQAHGALEKLRGTQRRTWMWRMACDSIMAE